jgi:DNA-binding transcriptional regulator/RsmH inhibitor MraZ
MDATHEFVLAFQFAHNIHSDRGVCIVGTITDFEIWSGGTSSLELSHFGD